MDIEIGERRVSREWNWNGSARAKGTTMVFKQGEMYLCEECQSD